MEKLMEILEDIRPDLDFEKEDNLIDGKVLDSFNIITIVTELNAEFDININVNQIVPANMNSAKAMWDLVCSLKDKT